MAKESIEAAPSEGTNSHRKQNSMPANPSRKSTMDMAEMYVSGTATPMTLKHRESLDFDDFFVRPASSYTFDSTLAIHRIIFCWCFDIAIYTMACVRRT